MRTTGSLVHLGRTDSSITLTDIDDTLNIIEILDELSHGSLNIDSRLGLLDGQRRSTLCWSHEEILDLLHVDFDHLYGDLIAYHGVLLIANLFEHFGGGQRNDTLVITVTEDRVRFARTSLTVGKDCIVKALPSLLQH